jgi:hypothetical protein
VFAGILATIVVTSPIWVPYGMTEEFETYSEPTRFQHYPYKDGAEGFLVLGDGPRPAAAFIDLGLTIGDDDEGNSISASLLTKERLGVHINQAWYEVDSLDDAERGSISLHAMYLFARNEQWAFNIGLGGRYEHKPIQETTLSGLYRVDWFPVRPIRLSGSYEYDGESHFRLACAYLIKRVGVGLALRSDVVDGERYQKPELFVSIQF